MKKETYIEQIGELHPDLIAGFLATGKCDAIPEPLRLFIQQLQWAIETFETERSISRCATKLRQRIAAEQHIKMEQRAQFAALKGDLKTQSKATERALECRRRAAEIADTDRSLGVTMLFHGDITPELMGLEKKSLKEIARKDNDGEYLKIINQLPLESLEKKRILRDADIKEAEIIEEL